MKANPGGRAAMVVAARRTVLAALAVLFLTSVHHLYGAYVYATPWRAHAAHVSALAASLLIGSFVVLRRRAGTAAGRVACWIIVLVTLALPVLGIGLFEGGYNHALKVALYYGHASPALMSRLFPPPTYELPNDAFFEITGVLQLALGAFAARQTLRTARERATGPGVSLNGGGPGRSGGEGVGDPPRTRT